MGLIKNICVVTACAVGGLALGSAASAAPSTAYVSNYVNDGTVSPFTIGAGGELTANGTAPAGGIDTWYEAVTPNGRYLYATNLEAVGTVAQFRIKLDGTLAALSPATIPAGSSPTGLAVSPNGKHAYVAEANSDAVAIFNVAADGKLTPNAVQTTEMTGLNDPTSVAVSPDGKSVYVPNNASTTVSEFNVASNGTLTPKATPTVSAGPRPSYVVITPNGKFAYATNYGNASISEYRVGAGGRLIHNGVATGVGAGDDDLYSATVSPNGKSLYAPNDADIYQFSIGPTGVLTPKSPTNVETGPGAENLWFTADGKNAYSANYVSDLLGSVSEWNLTANGGLKPKSTPTVSSVPGAAVVMIAPDQGPVARFTPTPTHAGAPTRFNASASHDSDGRVAHYAWRFGDGKRAQTAGPTVSHVYAKAGQYTITLTVTDDEGCSTSFVFTGVTAYCNGSGAAVKQRKITIAAKH